MQETLVFVSHGGPTQYCLKEFSGQKYEGGFPVGSDAVMPFLRKATPITMDLLLSETSLFLPSRHDRIDRIDRIDLEFPKNCNPLARGSSGMTAMSVLRRVQDTWDVLLANDASHAKAEWVKEISPRMSGPIVSIDSNFYFFAFSFLLGGGYSYIIYFCMHNTA